MRPCAAESCRPLEGHTGRFQWRRRAVFVSGDHAMPVIGEASGDAVTSCRRCAPAGSTIAIPPVVSTRLAIAVPSGDQATEVPSTSFLRLSPLRPTTSISPEQQCTTASWVPSGDQLGASLLNCRPRARPSRASGRPSPATITCGSQKPQFPPENRAEVGEPSAVARPGGDSSSSWPEVSRWRPLPSGLTAQRVCCERALHSYSRPEPSGSQTSDRSPWSSDGKRA